MVRAAGDDPGVDMRELPGPRAGQLYGEGEAFERHHRRRLPSAVDPRALFPFESFDLLRRRWVKARYKATIEELAARYPAFRVTGQPEIRPHLHPSQLSAGHLIPPK